MTIRLYLETNFLLSHATGRSPESSRLLSGPLTDLQIVVPTSCAMEALTALEGEQKRVNQLIGGNKALMNELLRNKASPHAARLAELLNQSIPEWEMGFKFFRSRLLETIHWLSDPSRVTCLETKPVSLETIREDSAKIDPTDRLILATILDDAREHPSATKVLLTENRRCFQDDTDVRQELRSASIRYFEHTTEFLKWYDAQAES